MFYEILYWSVQTQKGTHCWTDNMVSPLHPLPLHTSWRWWWRFVPRPCARSPLLCSAEGPEWRWTLSFWWTPEQENDQKEKKTWLSQNVGFDLIRTVLDYVQQHGVQITQRTHLAVFCCFRLFHTNCPRIAFKRKPGTESCVWCGCQNGLCQSDTSRWLRPLCAANLVSLLSWLMSEETLLHIHTIWALTYWPWTHTQARAHTQELPHTRVNSMPCTALTSMKLALI